MIGQPGVGVAVALRRVVVGYRVVAVLWLWLLAVVVLVTEAPRVEVVVATGAAVTVWAAVTAWIGVRRPAVLEHPGWLIIDIAVCVAVVWLSTTAEAERGFTGGYPFSTVLLVAYGGRVRWALGAAVALSAVTLVRLDWGEAIGSGLIYLAGAGVASWGMRLLEHYEQQRRELEGRLADERVQRLRSQERAETAATLHDGVLQTLALIQRRRDDPDAVASLARRQERDLRDWLTGRRDAAGEEPETFTEAIKDMAAEIEGEHPLTIEVVTVGDAPLTDGVEALVAAAGEALRNVAKHAQVVSASVYAEVTRAAATVFVRDRGVGFDVDAVPADRRGISESIVGRMHRHGGGAQLRSSPGAGTEVQLTLALPSRED